MTKNDVTLLEIAGACLLGFALALLFVSGI